MVYPGDREAKLFCELDGSPIGDEYVTWYKVGSTTELSSRYSTSFINKTSYLHISNPSEEDVGEYRCNVDNGIGNVTSKPILFITNCTLYRPRGPLNLLVKYLILFSYNLFYFTTVEPQMTNSALMKKAAANTGADVKLYCKARGSPLPKFVWHFGDKTLLPNMTTHKYEIFTKEVNKLLMTHLYLCLYLIHR